MEQLLLRPEPGCKKIAPSQGCANKLHPIRLYMHKNCIPSGLEAKTSKFIIVFGFFEHF